MGDARASEWSGWAGSGRFDHELRRTDAGAGREQRADVDDHHGLSRFALRPRQPAHPGVESHIVRNLQDHLCSRRNPGGERWMLEHVAVEFTTQFGVQFRGAVLASRALSPPNRQRAHPHTARFDNRKMAAPVITARDGVCDHATRRSGRGHGETKQHHTAGRGQPGSPSELTEILIEREQDATLCIGSVQDLAIREPRRIGAHPGNVVVPCAQRIDRVARHVLVRQEPHAQSAPVGGNG